MLKKVAVFASGNGSNFEALYQAQENGIINIDIELLVCNKKDAYVIERAREKDIEVYLIDYSKEAEEDIENKLVTKLKSLNIDLVLLAGFLKKLGSTLISYCPIINIHPSFLPKYKGLNAIERAFNNQDKEIGVSVHYIDEFLDNGPIILQEGVNVEDKSLEEVYQMVHQLEHQLYIKALQIVLEED